MNDAWNSLAKALDQQLRFCYCRLVETRGSTPQKAGAIMLVFEDGSQAGTLGGGCVEAEVKRKALAALTDGVPEVAVFTLDHDYGWDDGLICGGRMAVLLDPLCSGASEQETRRNYYRTLVALSQAGAGFTEVIAYDQDKSRSRSVAGNFPFSVCCNDQGIVVGSWHENLDAESLLADLRNLSERPRPYAANGIAFLPQLPRCRLIIVGGGHVGQAVARLADDLDFEISVVDDRADYVTPERFSQVKQRFSGPMGQTLPSLKIDRQTYCLIVTRGHSHDQEALYHLIDRGACYVGMIGSRRKIRLILDALRNEGIAEELLRKVYAPLGIDIGSQTVPEIAVSICAELISHRNRDGFVPGRASSVWDDVPSK